MIILMLQVAHKVEVKKVKGLLLKVRELLLLRVKKDNNLLRVKKDNNLLVVKDKPKKIVMIILMLQDVIKVEVKKDNLLKVKGLLLKVKELLLLRVKKDNLLVVKDNPKMFVMIILMLEEVIMVEVK